MNAKQRQRNRQTAQTLVRRVREVQLSQTICENCGLPGGHWHVIRGISLEGLLSGKDDSVGFYSCKPKA